MQFSQIMAKLYLQKRLFLLFKCIHINVAHYFLDLARMSILIPRLAGTHAFSQTPRTPSHAQTHTPTSPPTP